MLDQHEGHAAVGGQGLEDLLEGIETTRRRSQCDYWEINTRAFGDARPFGCGRVGWGSDALRPVIVLAFVSPGSHCGTLAGQFTLSTYHYGHGQISALFRQSVIEIGMFRSSAASPRGSIAGQRPGFARKPGHFRNGPARSRATGRHVVCNYRDAHAPPLA